MAQCTDLFFSEIMEGSSNNKAIEIYNPTSTGIDLSGYTVVMNYNSSDVNVFTGSGILSPGEVYVIAADAASGPVQAEADTLLAFPSAVHHTGDDMIALINDATGDTIDKFGLFGVDPGTGWTINGVADAGAENTLVRNATVQDGANDWATQQNTWSIEGQDDFTFLGSHTMTPCGSAIDTTVRFQPAAATVSEGVGTVDMDLVLNVSTNVGTYSVDVVLRSGSATDLDGYSTQTVTFNTSTSEAVTVTVTDDAMMEGTETFEFALRNPSSGFFVGADSVFTLTVTDNDLPVSAIGDINGLAPNGQADTLGSVVRVQGVVNAPNRGFNSTEFTIQENATGDGIGVFYPSSSPISYVPQVGDLIDVIGTVGENAGVTQLEFISQIDVLSSGNAVDTIVKTTVEELNESHLIRIDDLTLVDPAQWTAAGGSGFTAQALNASGDTIDVRIDRDYADLYNSNPPCDTFDVVGVSSQFDLSFPLFDDYQIIPRSLSDVIGDFSCTTPISAITPVDANGVATADGQLVRTTGQVISVNYRPGGLEFYINDGTDGVGVFAPASASDFGYTVTEGDEVTVEGEVDQFNGQTQLGFLDTLIVESTGNPLIVPTPVSSLDETTESELVVVSNLTLTNPSQWSSGPGFFEATASDGTNTIEIKVDADIALYNEPAPSGCFDIIGVGIQFDNTSPFLDGYQLQPRYITDVSVCGSVQRLSDVGVVMHPVPASTMLRLDGVEDFDAIEVVDATGRVVLRRAAASTIDVAHLDAGVYHLRLTGDAGTAASPFIKR